MLVKELIKELEKLNPEAICLDMGWNTISATDIESFWMADEDDPEDPTKVKNFVCIN